MSVYMPLDCDGFATALADYLEADAPDAVRAAVEAHAEECADCRTLLEDLQTIRHEAAALPALAPSRDLWSGIAERIDAPVIPLERKRPTIVPARRTWGRPAIAAAALVVVTAGITYVATRWEYDPTLAGSIASTQTAVPVTPDSAPTAPRQVASADPIAQPPAGSGPDTQTGQPNAQRSAPAPRASVAGNRTPSSAAPPTAAQLVSAEQPLYDREISKLRTIVRSRRAQLDPATIAVLEQSIAIIDSAIAQSRAALAKDPGSGFLATQLNHSLEKKVELLRTAAMLPART